MGVQLNRVYGWLRLFNGLVMLIMGVMILLKVYKTSKSRFAYKIVALTVCFGLLNLGLFAVDVELVTYTSPITGESFDYGNFGVLLILGLFAWLFNV